MNDALAGVASLCLGGRSPMLTGVAPAPEGNHLWAEAERLVDRLRTRTERELLPAATAVAHLCHVLRTATADLGDQPPPGAELPAVGALAWGDLCAVLVNDYRRAGGQATGVLTDAVDSVLHRLS